MTYTQAGGSTGGVMPRPDPDAWSLRDARAASDVGARSARGGQAVADGSERAAVSDEAWVRSQRVTVLMATFNRSRYIEEALESLLQQTRPPNEVIVVDDGSTDDTAVRVRRFGDRVRYFSQPNRGKSAAINRGLAAATGDWVWCFDDDDAALPHGLEQLLHGLARQRDADFAYGGQTTGRSGDDGRILRGPVVVLPPDLPAHALFARGLRNIPFLLQGAVVRRERFVALHGFDERYARSQDYEFLLRLLAAARGVRVPEAIFIWRSHDGPRGPEHLRHDVSMRERVWMEAGGRLGRDLRQRLPLAAYLPGEDGQRVLGMRTLRRALLERMSVMASKGLVREMLVDLHSAANLRTEDLAQRLARDEARICREVASFPFFQMRLLDAPDRVVTRLRLAASGGTGRAVLASIARGILHQARRPERSAAERRVLFRCAMRLFRACGPLIAASAYLPSRTH